MSIPANSPPPGPSSRWTTWVFRLCIVLLALVSIGFVVNAVIIGSRTSETLTSSKAINDVVAFPPGRRVATTAVRLRRLGGGAPVEVGGASGHPMVVNFFASWCSVCQQEVGAVAAVARRSKVRFVGVDTDDFAPGQALRMLSNARATYPVGIGTGPLVIRYGSNHLPTTAFLNRRGEIVALEFGALRRHQLTRLVVDLTAGRRL